MARHFVGMLSQGNRPRARSGQIGGYACGRSAATFNRRSSGRAPTRPSLLGEEHGQVGIIGGEPSPRLFELSHAVGAVGATALRLVRPHGDDGIDCPFRVILRAGRVLDADRPDLDLVTIVLQDDTLEVGGPLAVLGFAEIEVHPPLTA